MDAGFISFSYSKFTADPESLWLGGGAVQPPTAPTSDVFSLLYLEMVRDLHQMAQKSVING